MNHDLRELMENGVRVDFVQGVEQEPNLVGSSGGEIGHGERRRGVQNHHHRDTMGNRGHTRARAKSRNECAREIESEEEDLGVWKVIAL